MCSLPVHTLLASIRQQCLGSQGSKDLPSKPTHDPTRLPDMGLQANLDALAQLQSWQQHLTAQLTPGESASGGTAPRHPNPLSFGPPMQGRAEPSNGRMGGPDNTDSRAGPARGPSPLMNVIPRMQDVHIMPPRPPPPQHGRIGSPRPPSVPPTAALNSGSSLAGSADTRASPLGLATFQCRQLCRDLGWHPHAHPHAHLQATSPPLLQAQARPRLRQC